MSSDTRTAPSIPADVRALLDAPKYVHLATLRADGSPRNHVVWVGLEGDHVLVCTSDVTWKAGDIRRDPRVALSVVDLANPYRVAMLQGRVVEKRADEGCLPLNGSDQLQVHGRSVPQSRDRPRLLRDRGREAAGRTLGFAHNPG